MTQEVRQLRSWRQRIGQPLKGVSEAIPGEVSRQNAKTAKTPESLRVSIGETPSAKTSVAPPKPIVKDVAYWMSRCYRDGCENEPAATQDDRFRGSYCEPCQHLVRADAARLAATEGVGG